MKKTILLFIFAFAVLHFYAEAQNILNNNYSTDPNLLSFPSPQSASLGNFNRVRAGLYNGMLDINIPVYTLPVKGHKVSVALDYHTGGIKPNEKGGVVGVGWSLLGTGIITRIQNGIPDESINNTYSDSLLGYYWNRSQLNKPTWDNINAVDSFIYSIPCNGSPTGCNVGTPQWHDWAPDEFLFNFLGYTGSFWLDNNGSWQIREDNGEKLKISVGIGNYSYKYPTATQSMNLRNVFQNISITDGNGNVFVFGSDSSSVEFNRNMAASNSAVATSWYLSSITTSKGERINYAYQRIYPSATIFGSMNCYKAIYSSTYYNWNLQNLTGVLHDPVYLRQITYNKLLIQFKYDPSTINYYCCKPSKPYIATDTVPTTDIPTYISSAANKNTEPANGGVPPIPTDYQLDSIKVSYGNFSDLFTLNYYTTGANRLFLQSLTHGSASNHLIHQFLYNGISFYTSSDPQWLVQDGIVTTKVDHWGFYNGKLPFKTADLPLSGANYVTSGNNTNGFSYPSTDFVSNYYTNRQSVLDSTKVGSLSRIIYPTGGFTDFVYEQNDYSAQLAASISTDSSISLGHNAAAGGLRIKQVITHADSASTPLVRQFRYVNDNGYSSGVLNTAGIQYQDSLSVTTGSPPFYYFYYFYDNNQLPLTRINGSPITYSRVDEVNADSGKIVHRFNNHDNGNYDLLPDAFANVTANAAWYQRPNSRHFHRSEAYAMGMYDSAGTHVAQKNVLYRNDDSLTTNHVGVRAYSFTSKDLKIISYLAGNGGLFSAIFQHSNYWPVNTSAYVNYLHTFPITRKVDTLYSGSSMIAASDSFVYNTVNNKLKSRTVSNLSDGSSKTESYFYASDYASGNAFYTGMVNQNTLNPIVMKTAVNQSGKLLSYLKDSMVQKAVTYGNIYVSYNKKLSESITDTINTYIYKYDSLGDPMSVMGEDSTPKAYRWDYSSLYPVAIVNNALDTNVAYTSFEAESNGGWTVPDTVRDITYSITGAKSYDLTSAKTISATVLAGRQYLVTYWSRNGAVTVKANGSAISSSATGLTKSGFTYYEHLLPNTTSLVSVTGPSSSTYTIDELRLYPSDAQMKSYTYAPLLGVTSTCSPSNIIRYYAYDSVGRLSYAADMDHNIHYGYAHQMSQLTEPVGNDAQSGTYNKQGCGTGTTGQSVIYTVPANTYTSYISKADANQQAINDVNANGQTYANTNGGCMINIYCTNSAAVSGFTAMYHNTTTGATTYFTISSSGGLIGSLAVGPYNLTISKGGNNTNYYIGSGCGTTYVFGKSATFTGITVSTTNCNTSFISTDVP